MFYVNYGSTRPVATRARTLAGAKKAAQRNCPFIGQTIRVFAGASIDNAELVAYLHNDPINMNIHGAWKDA